MFSQRNTDHFVLYSSESTALETLEQVMTQALALANTDRSAVRAVCLAVSGVNHPSDQLRMLEWIRYSFLCMLIILSIAPRGKCCTVVVHSNHYFT
jgi:hypothetical protein